MGVLLEYKWWILVSAEVVAWIATLYMFVARYWYGSKIQFIIATILAGVTGYAVDIVLAFMDFYHTKTLNAFPFQVVLIMILGFVLANKYVARIDNAIKKWAFQKRTHLISENVSCSN